LKGSGNVPHDDDSTLTVVARGEAAKRGILRLLVVGEGVYATHPLPEKGDLVIGRSDKADICIEDPLISRKHAVLHVGPRILLEDLGSSNGVRVREAPLERRQTVEILVGDAIDMGSTTLIVQRSTGTVRPRRLWTHGAFEARLEDECARAERSGGSFALVRLHVETSLPVTIVQELIWSELRPVDVVASYGPNEVEILIVDTTPENAQDVTDRVVRRLTERGATVGVGLACHPRDGLAPEEIVAKANAAVRGEEADGPVIVVQDGAMKRLHRLVQRIAVGTISVVLLGETGVGKEIFAETIHKLSPRGSKPFLRLNCAALSETLLESELFGHERGSFTGAVQAKPGLLETAQKGTVFLDEVGELPLSTQVKLLRVIEERKVYRVGALKPRPIDVRFIAATNRDLEAQIAMGAFRQDLYFRLNGISLMIPPLRERLDELESLAKAFILQACKQSGRPSVPQLSLEALALLRRYSWPGNIRELRNIIERAVLLCSEGPIQLEHLPVEKMGTVLPVRSMRSSPPGPMAPGMQSYDARMMGPQGWPDPRAWGPQGPGYGGFPGSGPMAPSGGGDLGDLRGRSRDLGGADERERILEALDRCAGNQTKAAKLLGISRRTLVARLEQYDLPRPRKGTPR
jgi:two-component system response regulator AtoC